MEESKKGTEIWGRSPEHELVYVSGERQRHNRVLTKGLQRVPSAQRTIIPDAG